MKHARATHCSNFAHVTAGGSGNSPRMYDARRPRCLLSGGGGGGHLGPRGGSVPPGGPGEPEAGTWGV